MKLILFEWKLRTRNKRLKQQFIVFMLCFPLMAYGQLLKVTTDTYLIFLGKEIFILLVFIIPFTWTTYTFGINSAFIEKQITIPLPIFDVLLAKYRFLCILTGVLFVVMLPIIFFRVTFFELAATFIFTVGFAAFGLFCTALFTYKPFDIKSSTFANYQGNDAGSFWLPSLVLVLMLGIIATPYFLFNETVALIVMSVIGLIFIATHKIWLKMIANKFYETKYKRLEKFREK